MHRSSGASCGTDTGSGFILTSPFPAAEEHAAQQAQQDTDNDEGSTGSEGETDSLMEKDHTHDGGSQGLDRIERRAVACRKRRKSLIPENVCDSGTEYSHIQETGDNSCVDLNRGMGDEVLNYRKDEVTDCRYADGASCDNERVIFRQSLTGEHGDEGPEQNGKDRHQSSGEVEAAAGTKDEIYAEYRHEDACDFV